jgi:hypothetical protein
MGAQNIVVTLETATEEKALLRDILGSQAALSYIEEILPEQREGLFNKADVLFSWNLSREIGPEHYRDLKRVQFIQLLSAGVDQMPFPICSRV